MNLPLDQQKLDTLITSHTKSPTDPSNSRNTMDQPVIVEETALNKESQNPINNQKNQQNTNNNLDTFDLIAELSKPIIPDKIITPQFPKKPINKFKSSKNPEEVQKTHHKFGQPCKDRNCRNCGHECNKQYKMPKILMTSGDNKNDFDSQGVDPEQDRINKIIEETAKNSEFWVKEEKKRKECQQRIKRFRNKISQLMSNHVQWGHTKDYVSMLLKKYLEDRNLDRTWIYIDMDMFFAAVEIRDNPELKEKPIAVMDNQMIMTANYLARKFGVRSGMPVFIGKKLCPEMTFIKANYSKYKEISENFKDVLAQYDKNLESQGLDEASIDVTDFLVQNQLNNMEGKLFMGNKIRSEIFQRTKLTASCGIACNRLLAKICSGIQKPNGLTYLDFDQDEIDNFMSNLPIGKLQGVGKVHHLVLTGLGIKTCKDMIDRSTELYVNYSENQFRFFLRSAMGIDRNQHEDTVQKSIGVSQTFKPIVEKQEHIDKVLAMAIELYERLKESRLIAKTLTVEFKTVKFNIKQRSTTFNTYIYEKSDLIKASLELLEIMWPIGEPVRLIGIRLMHLRARVGKYQDQKSDQLDNYSPSCLRISNNSGEKERNSNQSNPSDDSVELKLDINPQQIGLNFDRARMNSSNRKAIDFFKANKKSSLGVSQAQDSQRQAPIQIKVNDSTYATDKKQKSNADIKQFLKSKQSQRANEEFGSVEYEIDDLLQDLDGSQKKNDHKKKENEENINMENQEFDMYEYNNENNDYGCGDQDDYGDFGEYYEDKYQKEKEFDLFEDDGGKKSDIYEEFEYQNNKRRKFQ